MDMKKAVMFGVGGLIVFGLYSIFNKKTATEKVDEITKEVVTENASI